MNKSELATRATEEEPATISFASRHSSVRLLPFYCRIRASKEGSIYHPEPGRKAKMAHMFFIRDWRRRAWKHKLCHWSKLGECQRTKGVTAGSQSRGRNRQQAVVSLLSPSTYPTRRACTLCRLSCGRPPTPGFRNVVPVVSSEILLGVSISCRSDKSL